MHALPTTDAATDARAWGGGLAWVCERHFAVVVWGLAVVAGGIRLALLREFWLENPFAEFPTLDSELYWQWAADLAGGAPGPAEPFHIAPLYPYLLAAFRWCGGDLLALYCAQMGLHIATGAIVAAATRDRFGRSAGCVAALLFFGLAEPALFATRILATTLQLFLVSVLWWDATTLSAAEPPSGFRVARIGVWLGLLALAFPAALLLIPAYAAWLALWRDPDATRGGAGRRLGRACLGVTAALVVVSPATLHNYRASGELIPVTVHAGVTLAAGNGPGSIGIFTPLDDFSGAVKDQARESARAFERATGQAGSWHEIDAFYRSRVLAWWLEHPLDAGMLFLRKVWWFLTSRYYDNVTAFALEREYGLQDASRWLPIEVPWIMGFAGLGAALLLRRARRPAPEIALIALPLVTCVLFMYSARYRAVAVPVLCGLAGYAATSWRAWARPRLAFLAAAGLPAVFLTANSLNGFGNVEFMRDDFADLLAKSHITSGLARRDAGENTAAEAQFLRASEIERDGSVALLELAALELDEERYEDARAAALRAVRRDQHDVLAHRLLYDAQIGSQDYRNGEITLNLIEQLTPRRGDVQVAMAWFYAANPDAQRRNPQRALHHARAAERALGTEDLNVVMALALARAAGGEFEAARETADRGAALARARDMAAVAVEFEGLSEHVANRRAIASPPPRLGMGEAVGS